MMHYRNSLKNKFAHGDTIRVTTYLGSVQAGFLVGYSMLASGQIGVVDLYGGFTFVQASESLKKRKQYRRIVSVAEIVHIRTVLTEKIKDPKKLIEDRETRFLSHAYPDYGTNNDTGEKPIQRAYWEE